MCNILATMFNKAALFLVMFIITQPVMAQSASTFQLSPGHASPDRQKPQGPVDPDVPFIKAKPMPEKAATSAATPVSAPVPAPVKILRPQPVASLSPAHPARAALSQPAPIPPLLRAQSDRASGAPQPASSPAVQPQAAETSLSFAAFKTARHSITALAIAMITQLSALPLWTGGAITACVIMAAAVWLMIARYKKGATEDDDLVWARAAAQPQDAATIPDQTLANPYLAPLSCLALSLEPLRLSATLLNTTLSYRLIVTNQGAAPVANIMLSGNMIAAHAALPMAQQLAIDGQNLDPITHVPWLEAGESITFTGAMRLPLAGITPIQSGPALLFVPLARFHAAADGGDAHAAFVLGKTPRSAKAPLPPFRLDLGPRTWLNVSAREISTTVEPQAVSA
ncbi:MAG: hypothetical protein RLZZ136_1160 [Pseudomonadota bacterium]|jgi:hypothetical protein